MSPEPPAETRNLTRRLVAEGLGSFFLFACVIGSGIMAQNLSAGNDAVALLGNTLATGAIRSYSSRCSARSPAHT
jgi:glycerol uptake facilitator-like aquaporin